MANLVECEFKPRDVLRFRKNRKLFYMYMGRHKNTGFIAQFNPKDMKVIKHRKVKIKTLNYCYEIDSTFEVLYGKK